MIDAMDRLELLRNAISGLEGVEFVRYTEASFQIRGRKRRVWIRPPSRMQPEWTATYYNGTPHRFGSLEEVVEWRQDQRDGDL